MAARGGHVSRGSRLCENPLCHAGTTTAVDQRASSAHVARRVTSSTETQESASRHDGVQGFAGGFGQRALGHGASDHQAIPCVRRSMGLKPSRVAHANHQIGRCCTTLPSRQTAEGASRLPLVGSSRLEEPLGRHPVTLGSRARHGAAEGAKTEAHPSQRVAACRPGVRTTPFACQIRKPTDTGCVLTMARNRHGVTAGCRVMGSEVGFMRCARPSPSSGFRSW